MILINLLPHREERRQRRKIAFYAGLGVAAVVGLAIVGVWYLVVEQLDLGPAAAQRVPADRDRQARRADQGHRQPEGRDRVAEGAPEGGRGPADRPQRAGPPAQRARQAGARGHVPHRRSSRTASTLSVTGVAQTQERVSEFLRNTAYNSEWLVKPELIESKATTMQGANREQKRLFDFSVRLTVKRPQDSAGFGAAGDRRRRGSRRAPAAAPRPRQEGLRPPWQRRAETAKRRPELGLRGRGVAVPRPQSERARPVAAAAEGADAGRRSPIAMVVAGWFLVLSERARRAATPSATRSRRSRTTTATKLAQAVNLGELRKQKLQVEEYVTQLEKQLPGKAEMDALLSDINQAGLGRGLQFELFRPGQVAIKDYYAELPIAIRVTGRYHDIGSFAADIANLSRIVTLHNLVDRLRQGPVGRAVDGRHGAHLSLSRCDRARGDSQERRRQGQSGSEEMTRRAGLHRCAWRARRSWPACCWPHAAATRTSCSSGWSSKSARSSRTSSRSPRRRSSIRSPTWRWARSSRSARKS